MCAERFSRPTETKRLNDRAPCSCAERCAPLLRFLVLGSCRQRKGSRAVCQAATVYEGGEDAVKRQSSSTAKIALRLGMFPSLRARTESISPTLWTLHPRQAPCTNCTTARRPPWLLSKRICRPSVRGTNAPMGMSRPAVTSRKPGNRRLMRIH